MPRTKTQRCRRLLVLFCMFVIFSAYFTVPAFADYVNVTTGTSYSYFQTYSSKGVYCFKVGSIAVKLEFDNNAPDLQDSLTDFFVRKKNGL